MSYWNHRVMRHVDMLDGEEIPNTVWYAIHEVYYDDQGKVDGWTQDPAYPAFYPEEQDGQGSIRDDILRFMRATEMPVLNFNDGSEYKS